MKEAFVLSVGVINPNTGTTMYDWGIYDEFWSNGSMSATLVSGGHLIFGAGKGQEPSTGLVLRGNDTGRLLKTVTVVDSCILSKENLLQMLKKNGYDYTPIRAFTKRPAGNRKLGISYVFK